MEINGENKRLYCVKNREENLPHELVIEILSRLPVKNLWPLRFVSKTWFQLLTKDPQFAKLQFDRFIKSNPNPIILASKRLKHSKLFLAIEFESYTLNLEFPFYQDTNYYNISGNCNGLLCIHRHDFKEVYIWNPVINDHVTVSCLPAPSSRFPEYHTFTGFGFGFDGDSNVYKVVRFFNEAGFVGDALNFETWTQVSVYTIGVDYMWRTIGVDLPCYLTPTYRILPLVNGVLHWQSSRLHTSSYDLIYTFDLKREVIGELLPPCGIKFNKIVELGGFFCVVDQRDESEMHIWVMKEYGLVSSWSKQYIIGNPHECIYHMVPLGFADNAEIIMDKYCGKLTLYIPQTNTFRDINGFQESVFLTYAYIGSIISPTVISGAGYNLLEEEN